MQNLKIELFLSSPLILDRTTTIDGILLAAYYDLLKKKGKALPFDKEHKTIEFLEKKNGVFSGSIWYVEKDAEILLDFMTITKKPEYRKLFDTTGGKKESDSGFKQYMGSEELISVDKIYFYIRAEKKLTEVILKSNVHSIGKKQSLGYGKISRINVLEVKENKGYMLDQNTPSKPLPTADFKINSHKVAYSRRMAPYWLDEDLESCYMPTTALYELSDNSVKNSAFVHVEDKYKHNCDFLYEKAHSNDVDTSGVNFTEITGCKDFKGYKDTRHNKCVWVTDNKELKCAITKSISSTGLNNDVYDFLKKEKSNFSDYHLVSNGLFLSREAIWSINNLMQIAYVLADSNQWIYLQGKNAVDGTRLKDFLVEPSKLKPPFSINLKDTQNSQHVSFKGKVSCSNAYMIIQYGNRQLKIDNELYQEAIQEIKTILSENKNLNKMYLCGNFSNAEHVILSKKNDSIDARKIIQEFQKKYNSDIRLLLMSVAL